MRILLVLLGVVALLAGAACASSSFASLRALDDDDYLLSGPARFTTSTVGFVGSTDELAGRSSGIREGTIEVRIRALEGQELFLGIAPRTPVEAYIGTTRHVVLRQVRYDPLEAQRTELGSQATLAPPADALPWVASASGDGPLDLTWNATDGDFVFVVLRGDGQPGLDVQLEFGTKFRYQRGFAIAGMTIGALSLVIGASLVILGLRRHRPTAARAGS